MKSTANTAIGNKDNRPKVSIICLSVVLLTLCTISFAQGLADQVQEHLRGRIEAAGVPPKIVIRDELIYSSVVLPQFYEQRVYMPAWSNNKGLLVVQVDALLKAIKEAYLEGLTPADYHHAKIEATLQEIRANQAQRKPYDPIRLADLDLLLTDAFLVYGAHLLAGRLDPETIDAQWRAYRREADLGQILQRALSSNNIEQSLRDLLPPQPGYARLREKLAIYRTIAARGGWLSIPQGSKLRKGDQDERVALLRKRLTAVGDLASAEADNESFFDEELDRALRHFQKRHGLTVDGVLGQTTLVALNVPAEHRVRQILVNMERWRWLPQDLGRRYIIVNIANYELDVVENSYEVLTTLVIVGKPYRRTPVFSDKMTYLVINPHWYVPHNIAVKDILPNIKKDPGYLAKNNIKLLAGQGTLEINPLTIDWSHVTESNFGYKLRQDPGVNNALGRIKFMFPNKYNVYIHDTPAKELFKKTERGFSSGCIRIERPIDLAEYVLREDPRWTKDKILAAINKGAEQTVRLPEAIPVHLLYWTAWADPNGNLQLRNDIYERDSVLYEALFEKPPAR
jgi:murein L,D-transpeptidase YcbB/YkuD